MRRYVRKGEKGIAIRAPIVGRKKSTDGELLEDEQRRVNGFKVAHVSDLTQKGDALTEFGNIGGDPQDATERLKAFIATKSITLEYDERIRPAHGLSSGGKITSLPGLSSAEEFSVLAHETAHELLHRGERRSHQVESPIGFFGIGHTFVWPGK
jgi:hypothetical protein